MDIIESLKSLAQQVEGLSTEVKSSFAIHSAQSFLLDVHYRGRLFVLDYTAGEGFGVDEFVEENDGLSTGFAHNYDDFPQASERLLQLIKEAISISSGKKVSG